MYDTSIVDEAVDAVTGDRAAAYGHPYDDFTMVAGMWHAMFGWEAQPEDVALAMIIVKLARERHSSKRDNIVDIVGYSLAYDAAATARKHLQKPSGRRPSPAA